MRELFHAGPLKVEQDGMGKVHVTVGSEGSQSTAEFDNNQLAGLPGALEDEGVPYRAPAEVTDADRSAAVEGAKDRGDIE